MQRNKTRSKVSPSLKPPSFRKGPFRRALLSWYSRSHRYLPWRETTDPYRIWISEVMLQQTQVHSAIPYYNRFIKQFPTLTSLARSPLSRVLKLWEGLGYYSRARNLHQAARMIRDRWKGSIPSDPSDLQSLPGIGRSTAGAISSIAFGNPAPIMDGNVRRVLCRILGIRLPPTLPRIQKQLWEFSEHLLSRNHPGDFSQAMMELGATVCLPGNPWCQDCPVRPYCSARREGTQHLIPAKSPPRSIPREEVAIALVAKRGSILMVRRPKEGFLAGLWGFPEIQVAPQGGSIESLTTLFRINTGLKLQFSFSLDPFLQRYSHRHVSYRPYSFSTASTKDCRLSRSKWMDMKDLSSTPVSKATQRILDQYRRYLLDPPSSGSRVAEGPIPYLA